MSENNGHPEIEGPGSVFQKDDWIVHKRSGFHGQVVEVLWPSAASLGWTYLVEIQGTQFEVLEHEIRGFYEQPQVPEES